MDNTQDPQSVFIKQLQLLRSAEQLLTKAIPGMMVKTQNFGLKKSLAYHLAETHQHKTAIDAMCKQLDVDPNGKMNTDLRSLIEEGEQQMSEAKAGGALDMMIINASLKIEQYEIEEYARAANYAVQAGYDFLARRLSLTQEEEKQAETKLKFIRKGLAGIKVHPVSL